MERGTNTHNKTGHKEKEEKKKRKEKKSIVEEVLRTKESMISLSIFSILVSNSFFYTSYSVERSFVGKGENSQHETSPLLNALFFKRKPT